MTIIIQAQTTTDFESFGLSSGEFLNQGIDGVFGVDNLALPNNYNENYDSFTGWAISATTDVTTPGFMNQFSSITGSGVNGSTTYGVAYVVNASFSQNVLPIELTGEAAGAPVEGFYVNNGTYGVLSMMNGDDFAKKFGGETGDDPDFFLLTINGELDGEVKPESVEFYLADYRFADNSEDYIVMDWTYINLLPLGNVDRLILSLTSSDTGDAGMNTPAYIYVDDITTTDMPLGVRDQQLDWTLEMYPNPAQNYLQVDWPLNEQGEARIFNAQGQLLQSHNLISGINTIHLSELPAGSYFLRYSNGTQWNAQHFVKI